MPDMTASELSICSTWITLTVATSIRSGAAQRDTSILSNARSHRLLDYLLNVVLGVVVLGLVVNYLSESFKTFVDSYFAGYGALVMGLTLVVVLGLILLLREYLSGKSAALSDQEIRRAIVHGLQKRYEERYRNKMSPELRFEVSLDLSYTMDANSAATAADLITQDELSIESFEQFCTDYTQRSKRMLIVGEPGSGKSLLLIRLALRMLSALNDAATVPIPVILNISNWDPHYRGRFKQWLAENLKVAAAEMGISESLAVKMVNEHSFVWLLDGLDELQEAYRDGFVDELGKEVSRIRRSRAAGETHPELVLCCRQMEFTRLNSKLPIHAIVHVRPLSPQRIDSALAPLVEQGDSEALRLQTQLRSEPTLYAALNTPFLIQAALVLCAEPDHMISTEEGVLPIRSKVTKDYVNLKLAEISERFGSSLRKTERWLGWLAFALDRRARMVTFRVVDIQASWTRASFLYCLLISLISFELAYVLILLPMYCYSAIEISDVWTWDFHKYPMLFGFFFALINATICAIFGIRVRVVNVERSYWHPRNLSWKLAWKVTKRTLFVFVPFYLLGLYMADWELYGPWQDLFSFFIFAAVLFLVEGPLAPLPVVVPVKGIGTFGRYGLYQIKRMLLRAMAVILVIMGYSLFMEESLRLSWEDLPFIFIIVIGFIMMHTIYRNNLVRHYCLRAVLWCLGIAPWRFIQLLEVASSTGGLLIKDGNQWRFRHQLLQEECASRFRKNA